VTCSVFVPNHDGNNFNYMRTFCTLCIIMMLAQAVTLNAGDRWNIRAMGMGRTSVVVARGTGAIGINPANLTLPGRGMFSLSLAPIGVRVSTELLSYDIYQEYFTGIPGTENGMYFGATITTSKLGGLGFAIIDHASGKLEVAKDFTRFFLYGLDSAGSQYNFDGTSASASWWREVNFSYAYQIPFNSEWVHDLSVGLGVKILQGFGVFETEHYSASVANQRMAGNQYLLNGQFDYKTRRAGADFFNPDKHVDMSMFPEPAGKGVGFDLGVSGQIKPGLRVAASITDIGSVHWTKNLVKTDGRYALVMDDPFKTENADSLEDAVRGKNQAGDEFSSTLPTTLRIGVAIESDESTLLSFLPGKMLLAFDYTQGLNSSMGNVTQPRFSLGMEYRVLSFLPLRTGFSIGGGEGFRWAGGFALDFHYVCLDIGTETFGMLFSKKIPQTVSIAAGLRVTI